MTAQTLRFRVERTEYAEIEIDVAGLLEEWKDEPREEGEPIEDYVSETLWKIGVRDLMYSGEFVKVLDTDTDEDIRLEASGA